MNTSIHIRQEIEEIVHRETRAWDTKDVDLLLSLFHPDMVWVWPKDNKSVNPIDWELPMGKFDRKRWKELYTDLFGKYKLIRNIRKIIDIKISREGDGAFAVVDIDTVWEDKGGKQMHWLGRVGKTYVKVKGKWHMISHFGVIKF